MRGVEGAPLARWEEEEEEDGEERWRKDEREGYGEGRRGSMCDVCGGHYEEPGVVARQRLSAPTYSHHPQPIPKTPLWDPPSPHGVLFLPFYIALSFVPLVSFVSSSLFLPNVMFNKHSLSLIDSDFNSMITTWYYYFRKFLTITCVYNMWNLISSYIYESMV